MIERMKQMLTLDQARTAVITIDMQRGALDPKLATLPVPVDECNRVLQGTQQLLAMARSLGVQVIHVLTSWHPCEIAGSQGPPIVPWRGLPCWLLRAQRTLSGVPR
jgi:nicotinamidase-related amidase